MNILVVTGYHVDDDWVRLKLFAHLSSHGHQVYRLDQPSFWIKKLRHHNSQKMIVPNILVPSRFASESHTRRAQVAALRKWTDTIDLVWIMHPDSHWIWSHFPKALKVYDAFDHFPALEPQRYDSLYLTEQHVVENADLVLCASNANYNRLRSISRDCMYLPNAVDPETMFAPSTQQRAPILGVVSYSESRVNWDLLDSVSQWNSSFTIEVVTHSTRSTRGNIRVLGPVPVKQLRNVMCNWQVGLIAYPESEFNRYAGPLKIFEYVAAGCNVVGIANPEVKEYSLRYPFIFYADKGTEFLDCVSTALEHPLLAEQQGDFLSMENWAKRAAAVNGAIASIQGKSAATF